MEDMRSKGGGRLKHCIVDGDVPLCKDTKEKKAEAALRVK